MKIDTTRHEGNALTIMATVRNLLREIGRGKEWPAVRTRMVGGNYANLCAVATEVSYGSIEFVTPHNEEDDL